MHSLSENPAYQKARLSRDARFDGLFFTAVKTTGIYCRPICPATPAREENVLYFEHAIEAGQAGYRPCLRCRPDSAPGSNAWRGTQTSIQRAIKLINEGALQNGSVTELGERLGMTDRYLRQLFNKYLGYSPKNYALYQQCLFAKQLLHQSSLAITDIALATGFNSVRRFNDCFKRSMGITPSQVRRGSSSEAGAGLALKLYYRPPFCWSHLHRFLSYRLLEGLEWCTKESYGRTIEYGDTRGYFEISANEEQHYLELKLHLTDCRQLYTLIHKIRQLFDLDANSVQIDSQLKKLCADSLNYQDGLRLPGIWSPYEAGLRAILGQQVAVKQACRLVSTLVSELGHPLDANKRLFPSPEAVANSDLTFLKIPQSRKNTLKLFSRWYQQAEHPNDVEQWLSIKGIGHWTVDYVKMRGLSNPDIWLGSDLGIKRVLNASSPQFKPEQAAPWRSYLTFQFWNQC